MADKDKKDNAPTDEIVPSSTKPKKAAPVQEDPQYDDDEQKAEERRLRQEKVKKRKEEMRKKAEQKRKQEQEEEEEEEEIEEDQPLTKAPKSKTAAKPAIRENVVNNSVMFLNHPKVKSAPMSQKIAYLQKKGLTQEEIQETIERAGESVPSTNTGYQSAPLQSYNNPAIPPRPSNYYGPQVPPPGYPPQPYPQQLIPAPPPPQPSWYGGKLGLAITVASCVGIGMGFSYIAKNYISPWLFNRTEKDNETKQREEYQTKVFEEMLQSLKSMQQSNTELKDYMKTQGELKDMIKTALDTKPAALATSQSGTRDLERMKIAELEAELKKMKAMMIDTKSLQSAASTSSYQTWNPTESKIPAWQRSVSSSNIPSVNTNATSQQNADSFKSPTKDTIPVTSSSSVSTAPSSPDPVPQSYAQILDMVRNGQLPDDIKDIDDKPREPFTPIEKGERESRPKPWQQKKAVATEPAPTSPTSAPANTEQANGHSQTEAKPATDSKPTEEIVS